MNNKTTYLTRAALIAAIYIALTFISQMFGLASGMVQFRLSETITFLPMIYGEAIPGLFLGCFLGNLLIGAPFWDVIFGSIATLFVALGTLYFGKKSPLLGVLSPVISNVIIIPFVLKFLYFPTDNIYPLIVIYVAIGEIMTAGIISYFLYKRFKNILK